MQLLFYIYLSFYIKKKCSLIGPLLSPHPGNITYFNGQIPEAQKILCTIHIPQLSALTYKPDFQKKGASLASKVSQLSTVIEMHHQNLGNALAHAQQGALYGALAQDSNLQIASFIQQANIYSTLEWSWKELEVYQQAYQLFREKKDLSEVSPLLEGRVAISLAKSYGKYKEELTALHCLDMAYEVYSEYPEPVIL